MDGFYVDFPGFDRNRERVFVQDDLEYGEVSGKLTAPIPLTNATNELAASAALAAANTGKPVVAKSGLLAGDATVSIDGKETTIQISSTHVNTVVGADGGGVALTNPRGYNIVTDEASMTRATFTMSWKDFYASFGDVTVRRVP